MVVHAYYPLGETRVQRQAQALIRGGHVVDVICLWEGWEPDVEIIDGITVYRLPVRRKRSNAASGQLCEYLNFFVRAGIKLTHLHAEHRYHTVQVHNLPDFLVFATFVPKLAGARVILDLHDLMPEFYSARSGSGMQSADVRFIALQESLACRFADHVITVTEPWRQTLIARGVPAHKVSVVMNVADDAIFHPAARVNPRRNNGHFNLIYHGNLSRRYGLDLAIRAVGLARNRIPALHLVLHGGGEAADELRALASQLDLNDCVTFSTDGVPTQELPALISRGDVGVVPYRSDVFTDGILPTKLMEYVALGLPVIAARTSAIRTYFGDNMVEFFSPNDPVDLARCIVTLYENPERRRQLVQCSEEFVRQYSWSQIASEYVNLIDGLACSSERIQLSIR